MNGFVVRFLSIILVLFLMIYTGFQAYRYLYQPYTTERAISYTVTDSVRVRGLVVRDETAFQQGAAGVLSFTTPDAKKVTPQSTLAHVYAGVEQAGAVQRIKEIDDEIRTLTQISDPGTLVYANTELLTSQINEHLGKLTQLAATGDAAAETALRSELQALMNKKQLATGFESGFQSRIDRLSEEKAQMLGISGAEFGTLKAPESGYFTRYSDGQEQNLSLTSLEQMDNTQLAQMVAGKYSRSESYTGKIVRDHNWYYAFLLGKRDAEKLQQGASVLLDFPSKRVTGLLSEVHSIQEGEDGKWRVILRCDSISPILLTLRTTTATVRFKNYSGLRVNSQAIRIVDGQTGVYIKTGYNIQFRPVNIIYQDTDYVICGPAAQAALPITAITQIEQEAEKQNETATAQDKDSSAVIKELQLFDEVIVGGTDLYDGKTLI